MERFEPDSDILAGDYDLPEGICPPLDTDVPPEKTSYTIKDFDVEDRPQEKALEHGCSHLAVADLWALVLRSGQPGMPVTELTRGLMRGNNNSLHSLARRSRKELMQTKGLGVVKALQIEAVFELMKRYNKEEFAQRYQIKTSEDIYRLMLPEIGNLPHEEIWAIFLSRQNVVMDKLRISVGSSSATIFDAKRVLKEALLLMSECVVLCHNHPSGAKYPSPQDDSLTHKFKNACQIMDIRLLDHVIVTLNGYYSYQSEGKL